MNTQTDAVVSSYDTKIKRAIELLEAAQFNRETLEKQFPDLLTRLGATDEEGLAFLQENDIQSQAKSLGGDIPPVTLRRIIAVFQEKTKPTEEPEKAKHISSKQADRMRFEQLLGFYDPDEPNAVSRKLAELGKGQPFIVFLPQGGVDVETSTNLLKEIRAGFPPRPNGVIEVNGSYQTIHKVGENPERYFEENPLYPGRPLRPDGTCDQLNRSWEGVDKRLRQFLYVGITVTKEIQITLDKAHDILDHALAGDRLLNLKRRYQKTAARFEELDEEGNLPTLRIRAGRASQINNSNDPFKRLANR